MRPSDDELAVLVAAALDGVADAGQVADLDRRLRSDSAARRLYLRHAGVHAALRLRGRESGLTGPAPAPAGRGRRVGYAACAAAVAVMVAVLIWGRGGPPGGADAAVLARVTRATAALAGPDPAPLAVGEALQAGPLDLTHGVAELRFASGAVALLQARVRSASTARTRSPCRPGGPSSAPPTPAGSSSAPRPRR